MEAFVKVEENLIKDLLDTQTQILNILKKDSKSSINNDDYFMSLKEAATYTSTSYEFLYKRVQDNSLAATRIGRSLRLKKSDLENFLKDITMKYNCRINKTPYMLWFTENKVLDIDLITNMSVDENGFESEIKKVNTFFIFLIKYLPILVLLVLGLKVPYTINEAIMFGGGAIIAFTLQYLFFKNQSLLKAVFVFLVMLMYIALFNGFAFEIELVALFTFETIILFFVYREIVQGKYKGYYYLKNYLKKAKITVSKKEKDQL